MASPRGLEIVLAAGRSPYTELYLIYLNLDFIVFLTEPGVIDIPVLLLLKTLSETPEKHCRSRTGRTGCRCFIRDGRSLKQKTPFSYRRRGFFAFSNHFDPPTVWKDAFGFLDDLNYYLYHYFAMLFTRKHHQSQ